MSESASFAIPVDELQIIVANDRGYSLDPVKWNEKQRYVIKQIVNSGVANVYFPPAADGDRIAPDWTFLKPISEVSLKANSKFAKMPDDFGSVDGPLAVKADVNTSAPWFIDWKNDGDILQMYSATPSQTGPPKFACEIVFKENQGPVGQRRGLMVFPTPDQDYILQLRYSINPNKLSGANPYAYGGAQYRELYIASCLAVAEHRFDGIADGPAAKRFNQMLIMAISQDNKNRPAKLGYNANHEPGPNRGLRHNNGMTFLYNGEPIT